MNKLKTIKQTRAVVVFSLGVLMLFGVWFLLTNILGSIVTSKTNIATGVTMTLFGVLLGILITASLCLFVYHGFSCFMKLTLPQTIRLNEAMRMLHATTTLESLATIKFYKITIFKIANLKISEVKKALGLSIF